MKKKCPTCGKEYTLGVDGTVDGCDACEGITRNLAGQIIYGLIALALVLVLVGCAPVTATPPKAKAAAVVQVAPTATPQVRTLCGDVNVRGGASPNGRSLGWKYVGDTVEVLEWGKGWVRIGTQQWITASVLCP